MKLDTRLLLVPSLGWTLLNPAAALAEKMIVTSQRGLEVGAENGAFAFRVGGAIQADAAFYNEDMANLGNGTELRRTELQVAGTLFTDWAFRIEYDFAVPKLNDAYLSYDGLGPLSVTAGQFKEPFSLDFITSSKNTTFMERSLLQDAFVPGRRIGLGLGLHDVRWSGAVGAFGGSSEDDSTADATARPTAASA